MKRHETIRRIPQKVLPLSRKVEECKPLAGGRLKWAMTGTWSFYQPGSGGMRFMLLQAFGWVGRCTFTPGCPRVDPRL
jgi:hypothetical protein